MNKQKRFLILPGTKWQLALVKRITEIGHLVYLVDPSENPPCAKYADKWLKADIFDEATIEMFIDKNPIDAVISDECDIATPIIARIGEKHQLTAISPSLARLYTDKYRMREFCKKIGLKYPEYSLCKSKENAFAFFQKLNSPMIIKPLDCNASKGVFAVCSEEDIQKHFDEAMRFSRIEKLVLAERYIQGTEFTIDGIKTPSAHYTLAISEKKHFAHNINIANELRFSHYHKHFDYEQLRKTNDKFVLESGLPFGFTHAEYKYENGDFYLIEIAARGGGNEISSVITQYLSGYHTYDYLIQCALGEIKEKDFSIKDEYWERSAVLKFFDTPRGGGRVKEIYGLDYLNKETDIVEYALNFSVDDNIEDCISDSARIGFYIACSENMEKLQQTMKNVEEKFSMELW